MGSLQMDVLNEAHIKLIHGQNEVDLGLKTINTPLKSSQLKQSSMLSPTLNPKPRLDSKKPALTAS